MPTETAKLTIRLPKEDIEFAKRYAREHGMTVTEVIDRYLRRMKTLEQHPVSSELEFITGLVPADVEGEELYRKHLLDKHG